MDNSPIDQSPRRGAVLWSDRSSPAFKLPDPLEEEPMTKLHDQLDQLEREGRRKSFPIKVGDRAFTIAEADMPGLWAAFVIAGFEREPVKLELASGEMFEVDIGDLGQTARQILAQLQAQAKATPATP